MTIDRYVHGETGARRIVVRVERGHARGQRVYAYGHLARLVFDDMWTSDDGPHWRKLRRMMDDKAVDRVRLYEDVAPPA